MKKLKWLMFYIVFIMSVCILKSENVYADGDDQKAKNLTEFRQIVYKDMLERKEKIVIDYYGKDYKSIFQSFKNEEFLNYIGTLDDVRTSDDFDYMVHNISYIKTGMKYGSGSSAQFTINITWRESLGELQYVNLRVADIIKKCNIENIDSVYERIKVLHDYIVENVEYDVSLKNENAYSAIKEGSSTCQGYSLLFYKLLAEAGIKSRYITGTGISSKDTGPHGWNIVKIGGVWYNVDVTWDDPVYLNGSGTNKEVSYEYFLKGSRSFDDSHKRDEQFLAKEFTSKHPTSGADFDKKDDVKISEIVEEGSTEITPIQEEEVEEEESNNILDRLGLFFSGLLREKDHIPTYLAKSFKELDEQSRGIIIALLAIIAIAILFKIFKSGKKCNDNDSFDENSLRKSVNSMMDSQNNKKEPVNTNVNNKPMNTNINKQSINTNVNNAPVNSISNSNNVPTDNISSTTRVDNIDNSPLNADTKDNNRRKIYNNDMTDTAFIITFSDSTDEDN